MVRDLAEGNEILSKTCRDAFKVAEEADDQGTMDLLIQRMQASEKAAWMLRSHLA
jgi:starvation-inducible DNA-binding protein